jgi:NADH:ubiquinone oxidoreductase subunit C
MIYKNVKFFKKLIETFFNKLCSKSRVDHIKSSKNQARSFKVFYYFITSLIEKRQHRASIDWSSSINVSTFDTDKWMKQ